MEIDRKELKRQAREAMRLPKPNFLVVTLVYLLMTTGLSTVLNAIPFPPGKAVFSTGGLFVDILYGLYYGVVSFGFTLWCLWTHRRLEPGLNSLTQGFSVTGRVLLMQINIYLRILLITLGVTMLAAMLIMPLAMMNPFFALLASLVSVGTMIVVSLRYALAPFLLADNPNDGPGPAIRRSVELMQGWKMELFKLDLSFLGWQIINFLLSTVVILVFVWQAGLLNLAAITSLEQFQLSFQTVVGSPIVALCTAVITLPLSLWLLPYQEVSHAAFYDARLRWQRESAPTL